MITLWGVWHCTENRWLGGLPNPWLYTDRKDAEATIAKMQDGSADYVNCLVVRLYGQFVQVPPEVVEAARRIKAAQSQNKIDLSGDDWLVYDWAAQCLSL